MGNKSDLAGKRQVEFATAKEFADRLGVPFLETSAKNSTNVEQAFLTMAKQIKDRVGAQQLSATGTGRVNLPSSGTKVEQSSAGCC